VESLPPGFGPETLPREARVAAETLGLPGDAATVLDFPVRHFHAHRQEILEWMVARRRQHPPDLVFAPASSDLHQDHAVIHQEAVRGFRGRVLLGYELPWNNRTFTQSCGIALREEHVTAKIRALASYHSQAHRPYIQDAVIRGWAMTRGVTFNVPFAEAFEALQITIPLP
jgi:LmbE family N-acetylglucosaminyl deacetylase